MENDFKDAEHYASTIRTIIIEEATNPDVDEPAMPETLVAYWAENMYDACYKAYNDYIIGKRDDYKLNDIESAVAGLNSPFCLNVILSILVIVTG